jgi:eukaryotic-like serine/threonine-protein kinase
VIAEAGLELDADSKRAVSIAEASHVILPSIFKLGEPLGHADKPLLAFALKSTVDENYCFSMSAVSGQQPIKLIGNGPAAVGRLNLLLGRSDGAVREERS